MKKVQTVAEYIDLNPGWASSLQLLRNLILQAGYEESIKWGAPSYAINGKNVVGLGAFKKHLAIWFHQGALLNDPEHILINAQENKTKALRQWRFSGYDDLVSKTEIINSYLIEAKENQLKGKEIALSKPGKLTPPAELETELKNNPELKSAFNKLSPGRQREYAEYIGEAKRAATRQSRLAKSMALIKDGKGLHDKYRK